MEGVAIASHELIRLGQPLLKRGIVSSKPVISLSGLNQENSLAISRTQTANGLLGQHHTERLTELADLEFKYATALRYYDCYNSNRARGNKRIMVLIPGSRLERVGVLLFPAYPLGPRRGLDSKAVW